MGPINFEHLISHNKIPLMINAGGTNKNLPQPMCHVKKPKGLSKQYQKMGIFESIVAQSALPKTCIEQAPAKDAGFLETHNDNFVQDILFVGGRRRKLWILKSRNKDGESKHTSTKKCEKFPVPKMVPKLKSG